MTESEGKGRGTSVGFPRRPTTVLEFREVQGKHPQSLAQAGTVGRGALRCAGTWRRARVLAAACPPKAAVTHRPRGSLSREGHAPPPTATASVSVRRATRGPAAARRAQMTAAPVLPQARPWGDGSASP